MDDVIATTPLEAMVAASGHIDRDAELILANLARLGWVLIRPVRHGAPPEQAHAAYPGTTGEAAKDPIEAGARVVFDHLRRVPAPLDLVPEWEATGRSTRTLIRAAMADALDAAVAAQELARRCDEPGCTREASCGFPTEAGYRRTCADHHGRGRDHG